MYKQICLFSIFIFSILTVSSMTGCSPKSPPSNHQEGVQRNTTTDCLVVDSSGTVTYGNDLVTLDASNSSQGYIMVQYKGASTVVKLQITIPDGTIYTYALHPGNYESFPLSGGSGDYKITLLEPVQDEMYAIAFSTTISVSLVDEFHPFLYPNQYVWYGPESKSTALGIEISQKSSNDLDYVENIYEYVIKHITYDEQLADNVPAGYLPNVDQTLDTGKGICFDYAALMAALLRSQQIPTKLEVGYSGDAYHAWISVYLKETGWVSGIIQFDGTHWSLMDPTLAANNSSSSVKKYIGNGSNYTVKYSY